MAKLNTVEEKELVMQSIKYIISWKVMEFSNDIINLKINDAYDLETIVRILKGNNIDDIHIKVRK